jgi:hypothetical protein
VQIRSVDFLKQSQLLVQYKLVLLASNECRSDGRTDRCDRWAFEKQQLLPLPSKRVPSLLTATQWLKADAFIQPPECIAKQMQHT